MNRGANKYGTITHAILSLVQALHLNKLFRYKLRTATHPDEAVLSLDPSGFREPGFIHSQSYVLIM